MRTAEKDTIPAPACRLAINYYKIFDPVGVTTLLSDVYILTLVYSSREEQRTECDGRDDQDGKDHKIHCICTTHIPKPGKNGPDCGNEC